MKPLWFNHWWLVTVHLYHIVAFKMSVFFYGFKIKFLATCSLSIGCRGLTKTNNTLFGTVRFSKSIEGIGFDGVVFEGPWYLLLEIVWNDVNEERIMFMVDYGYLNEVLEEQCAKKKCPMWMLLFWWRTCQTCEDVRWRFL